MRCEDSSTPTLDGPVARCTYVNAFSATSECKEYRGAAWNVDMAEADLSMVPTDFTYVLNFAVVKSGNFEYDLAANAEGAGRLLARQLQ